MAAKKKTTTKPRGAPKGNKRALGNKGGGRPSSYKSEYTQWAEKFAKLGATDADLADAFEVSEVTINNWKRQHPEFSFALKEGKAFADAKIASSLFQAALGGGTVTEVKEETDAQGNVVCRKTVKELPANVTAQIFWLKNRQPRQWRDKVVLEDGTPPALVAETANQFVAIMEAARERQRQVLIERGLLSPDGPACSKEYA